MGGLYALFGLIIGGFFTLFSLAGMAAAAGQGNDPTAILFGAGAVIVIPLLYGFFGFIGGIITALIYNLVAMVFGGVEIELSQYEGIV